jgi:hypothetical protein
MVRVAPGLLQHLNILGCTDTILIHLNDRPLEVVQIARGLIYVQVTGIPSKKYPVRFYQVVAVPSGLSSSVHE